MNDQVEKDASVTPETSPNNLTTGSQDRESERQVNAERPPREVHGLTWVLIVISMLGSTFLYALDNTVVADVQAEIVRSLGGIEKLPWLGTAFVWATMSAILIWSRLYAAFDAKWLYLISSTIFEVGSAICGAAPNIDSMIVGRALAGLGASGMYMGCLTFISVQTSEKERPTYMGYTGVSWGAGFILGPVIGGAFAQSKATWRWAFYINLLLFAVFGPIFIFLLPHYRPQTGVGFLKRVKQIDWLGAVLELGGTLSGILAISFGGTVYSWRSGRTISLFVTSGVCMILFFLQQYFAIMTSKTGRIFPLQLFRSKTVVLIWLLIVLPSIAVVVPIYYQPILFQFDHGDSPIDAAVRLLPTIIMFVFFVMVGSLVVSRTGWFYPWFLVGSTLLLLGSALMYADIDINSPSGKSYGYTALMGIGAGAIGQLSYSMAQFKVEPELVSSTVGLICMGQYFGITLGLTICGAIFQNLAQKKVSAALPPGTSIDDIRAAIQGLGDVFSNQDPRTNERVLEAIVWSVTRTYALAMAAGAAALLATLLLN